MLCFTHLQNKKSCEISSATQKNLCKSNYFRSNFRKITPVATMKTINHNATPLPIIILCNFDCFRSTSTTFSTSTGFSCISLIVSCL